MKSIYVKIIAVVIFMCCIGTASFLVSDIVSDFNSSEVIRYDFEKDFKDSQIIRQPLNDAFYQLTSWICGKQTKEKTVSYLNKYDYILYYAEINGITVSNTEKENININSDYAVSLTQNNEAVYVERGSSHPFWTSNEFPKEDFVVLIEVSEEYAKENMYRWYREKDMVERVIYVLIGLAVLMLLSVIYLAWVCGNKELLIDRIYTEINIFLMLGFGAATIMAFAASIGLGLTLMYSVMTAVSVGTAILSGLTLAFMLSLVRNLKNKTFLSRSLIWTVLKFIFSAVRKIRKGFIKGIGNKASKILSVLMIIYTACIFLLTVLMEESPALSFVLIMGIIIGSCILIAKGTSDFDKIRTGITEIRNGNTDYKVTDIHIEILKDVADSVNTIGDGVSKAVERQTKAERMKSELITNVSHDLKTPLTSIISYADLLCGEKLQPDVANDYAKVIKEKSERLKNLTADLFDISKVQSGNETILKENLDISLLIKQSVGEADAQIKESGLEFVINVPDEEVIVTGDGKKLSRAFENLVMNAVKYSMKNTRVYIDVKRVGGKCTVEMKNISSYPLNFDCEEITERFVRGDMSRTTEGSGLGLAIVKSYVEACGGSFKITTDGDLFKATVTI